MRQNVDHPDVVFAENFHEFVKDGAEKSLPPRRQTFCQLRLLWIDRNDRLVDPDHGPDDLLPDAALGFEVRDEDGQRLIQRHDVSDHVADD